MSECEERGARCDEEAVAQVMPISHDGDPGKHWGTRQIQVSAAA